MIVELVPGSSFRCRVVDPNILLDSAAEGELVGAIERGHRLVVNGDVAGQEDVAVPQGARVVRFDDEPDVNDCRFGGPRGGSCTQIGGVGAEASGTPVRLRTRSIPPRLPVGVDERSDCEGSSRLRVVVG